MEFLEDFVDEYNNEKKNSSTVRRRGVNRTWLKLKEFDNAQEAETYVKEENAWSKTSIKKNSEGTKVEYRCNMGSYRYNECPLALYLLYHATNNHVSIFKTDSEHQHNTIGNDKRGLNEEIKKFIKKKFEDGIKKPNAILALIKKENMTEPSKIKIINFLRKLRQDRLEIFDSEIADWCENKKKIPADDDTPFVLKYDLKSDSCDVEQQDLKIFISSKRLLRNAYNSEIVQIDATISNKLIWQGYSVIIVGTSDANQVFHPCGLGICKNETAADFKFIFDSLKIYCPNWDPKILLADGSDVITEGFTDVFGAPKIRLMCFFHVLQNIEKYIKQIKEKDCIKNDIKTLQICYNEEQFKLGIELFIKKWILYNDKSKDFIDYFKKQWFDKNMCWYEGAAIGYPSSNNGIEVENSLIKKEHALRERLPINEFLDLISNIISRWSHDRNPQSLNNKEFSVVYSPSMKDWKTAYRWAISNKEIIKEEKGSLCFYYVKSFESENKCIAESLREYRESIGQWKSFEEFVKHNFSVWSVCIDNHRMNTSFCTCPYFLKHITCKHLMGIKIRLKILQVPEEAKIISYL